MDLQEVALGMTFAGSEPAPWLVGRPAVKITMWSDGTYYVGIRLDSPECDRVLGILKHEGQVPLKSLVNVYYREDWWKTPDDSWVGAILSSGEDYVHVSPANTFDPVCPPPCYGLVPPHLPLHVLGRPRAHVVGVKFEDVFSGRMAAFLAELAPCQFGNVVFDNQVLQSHRRLFPERARNMLAGDLMTRVRCALCSSWDVGGTGYKLGRRVSDLVMCRNEEGVGHLAAEHPVIVSIAVAQEMKHRFPRGYGLQPILDIDSPTGQRIVHLFRQLQALEALRGADGNRR